MQINPNYISERTDRIIFTVYMVVFVFSGLFITWFLWHHTTGGNENAVGASSMPACRNNVALIRHNYPVTCDLTAGGILIELGTSRTECADAGGRFLVINDRRMCAGEDF